MREVLRAGGMVQVVGCLPSKLKALSSNPQYCKKKTVGEVLAIILGLFHLFIP
jgi:hypothetical protein